jgi:hypothetical protein
MRGSWLRVAGRRLLVVLALCGTTACRPAEPSAIGAAQALQGPQDDVAALCGFDCEPHGLADGNAVISGVNPPDAFFATVVAYARGTQALANAIDREMTAVAADFGVSGDVGSAITEQTMALAKGGTLRASAGRPQCFVEARSLLDAEARCDAGLDRTSATMRCAGTCEVARDAASCPDKAVLHCVQPVRGRCDDACRGECASDSADKACAGDCFGACSGTCLTVDADGDCAGPCDGTCDGTCSVQLMDPSRCDGDCSGECVVEDPRGGCGDDAIAALCVAPDIAACAGSCDGEPIAAAANPACMISAQVDALLNLGCRGGGASLTAIPIDAPEDPAALARYLTALDNLEHRLPHLLVLAEQGERLLLAGDDIKQAVRGAELPQSIAALNMGDIHTRFAVGTECASSQLAGVEMIVDTAGDTLAAQVDAVGALRNELGLVTP